MNLKNFMPCVSSLISQVSQHSEGEISGKNNSIYLRGRTDEFRLRGNELMQFGF